ncbi:hypothetical protein VVD49_06350 [Uliginosibacterium sp. H3]|uniref:Phage tail protein n=1 Tax=Uliginosibacterium silvisoli TaxID=3114758 RepID=A0ABU6K0Y8_9RHOO|nr:hypothetical protein [Uliginosibacterium sp. H3]
MSLYFETASPLAEADRHRADVACFIGFVARRPLRPLPAALRAQLVAAGWVEGTYRKPASQIESLENLPVVIDSWDLFDELFAWEARPLAVDGSTQCATYLGAAVRSFFSRGGKRAIVIRVGDPWPFLESGSNRAANRRTRLRKMLPDFADRDAPAYPFAPYDPGTWQGIHHLYGLRENSMLVMPDLADACTFEPIVPDVTITPPPTPEGFVECSEEDPVSDDTGLRDVPAPRLDSRGYAAWQLAVSAARGFLNRYQREVMLIASLPLPDVNTQRVSGAGRVYAQGDMLAYLQRVGVISKDGSIGTTNEGVASAFVQLAWPWLRTQASGDLPEGLESPDGVLAGLISTGAALRGSFRSVAGEFSMPRLRDIAGAEPVPAWGQGDDSPAGQLAKHVCTFAQAPDGWALQSDVTTSPDESWRFGGASRLMGTILRAARVAGDGVAFDLNGPQLWAQLRGSIEDMLMEFWREGAFSGASAAEAFSVLCGRNTMTQADLDAGRLIVHISVRPAMSIERITVVLNLANTAGKNAMREVA